MRVVYLHGFASSPASQKARFFVEHLGQLGFQVSVPDLAEGDFRNLTLTRQLKVLDHEVHGEPVILVGSSMGGYIATLFAQHHPEVQRLVLLAPAFDFYNLWRRELGPERFAEWQQNCTINVFHYGEGREVPLGFGIMADASLHDPFPNCLQPVLLFHGTRDPVAPSKYSASFAKAHSNTRLVLLDSGHELTDVLHLIWPEVRGFLLDQDVKSEC